MIDPVCPQTNHDISCGVLVPLRRFHTVMVLKRQMQGVYRIDNPGYPCIGIHNAGFYPLQDVALMAHFYWFGQYSVSEKRICPPVQSSAAPSLHRIRRLPFQKEKLVAVSCPDDPFPEIGTQRMSQWLIVMGVGVR